MAEFKILFEEYGGDYEATMRRFMGNEALYVKILSKLPTDPNLQNLRDALHQGNISDAFEAAHTLKGVSGNLGLTPLYDAVCAIVEPLRAGMSCGYGMYRNIESEFRKVETLLERIERGEGI